MADSIMEVWAPIRKEMKENVPDLIRALDVADPMTTRCGLRQIETDPCVFTRRSKEGKIMAVALLYVDDIAVSTAENEYWDHVRITL